MRKIIEHANGKVVIQINLDYRAVIDENEFTHSLLAYIDTPDRGQRIVYRDKPITTTDFYRLLPELEEHMKLYLEAWLDPTSSIEFKILNEYGFDPIP